MGYVVVELFKYSGKGMANLLKVFPKHGRQLGLIDCQLAKGRLCQGPR